MRCAIDALMSVKTSGRHIAVLADMLELGRFSADEHFKIGLYAAAKKVAAILLTGAEARHIQAGIGSAAPVSHFDNKNMLIAHLKEFIKAGDVLLIKGSRGMKMEDVAEALR